MLETHSLAIKQLSDKRVSQKNNRVESIFKRCQTNMSYMMLFSISRSVKTELRKVGYQTPLDLPLPDSSLFYHYLTSPRSLSQLLSFITQSFFFPISKIFFLLNLILVPYISGTHSEVRTDFIDT